MGAPITISETLTLREFEYLPDENLVRHVVAWTAQGLVERSTEPVEQYAYRECMNVGAEAVCKAIEERFDSPLENINIKSEFDDDDDANEKIVVVYTVWTETRERAVKSTPNIDFDDLVAVTPQRVQTTVELEGEEYSYDVPVFIRTTEASLL